ncbi:MAG TPA: helix-turn-helix domain-containing protein [Candidatus Saccharimonadales bacterium]|nr:helix-turn-helix domain-containing protein [Candidatus Saccharimonadales bacterium]
MQIDQLAKQLQAIGLSDKQAKVYVASLFLGPAPAQKIAEQAGINRPTTYNIIELLSAMGLMTRTIDRRKTLFVAGGAGALEQFLKTQADTVEQRRQELARLAPTLASIEQPKTGSPPVVRFVRGKKGVDSIRDYVLRKARPGSEILSMTNFNEVLKKYPDHMRAHPRVRLGKHLSSKQFYFGDTTHDTNPEQLRETIRLRQPIAADVTLYEDRAIFLSYGSATDKEWTGVVIESAEIVSTIRQLFMLAWRTKRKKSE